MRPPTPPDIETDTEDWLAAHGLKLVAIPDAERSAACQRLSQTGDPARRCALRLIALWSLAPRATDRESLPFVPDIADFLEMQGFAVEDDWGERTFDHGGNHTDKQKGVSP